MTEKNVIGTEAKSDQYPVFRADIMDQKENLIQAPTAIPRLTPATVSPINHMAPSIDAISQWRMMSERYRDRRLAAERFQRESSDQKISEPRAYEKDTYHSAYGTDTITIVQPESGTFKTRLIELFRKAQQVQMDPSVMVKPVEETYHFPNDGILRVAEAMTRHVVSIIDSTTVQQVVEIFHQKQITGLPVVNYANHHLLGLITMSDILHHIFDQKSLSTFIAEGNFMEQKALAILERPVRDFMTKTVVTVSPGCPVKDACQLMQQHHIHRLIITRDHGVKGIFTAYDALRILSQYSIQKVWVE